MHGRTLLLLVGILSLSAPAEAQREDSVALAIRSLPSDLSGLATGGAWPLGDSLGYFRVAVFDQGWEHIRSRVIVQWMFADHPDSLAVSHATVSLDSLTLPKTEWLEAYAVGPPTFRLRDGVWHLILCATNSYSGLSKRWTIRLGRPGSWAVTETLERTPANDACY